MIIWLASYPRSGNTFFRHVCNKGFGVNVYAAKPGDGRGIGDNVLNFENNPLFDFAPVGIEAGPYIVKTHEQDHAMSGWPAIHIVRDARASFVSRAHERFFKGANAVFAQVVKEFVVSDEWSLHTLMWLDRTPATVLVRFEELIASPATVVSDALRRSGIEVGNLQGNILRFEELHKTNPQFFRQGKADGWREEFPASLNNVFWRRHGEAMERLGYTK